MGQVRFENRAPIVVAAQVIETCGVGIGTVQHQTGNGGATPPAKISPGGVRVASKQPIQPRWQQNFVASLAFLRAHGGARKGSARQQLRLSDGTRRERTLGGVGTASRFSASCTAQVDG